MADTFACPQCGVYLRRSPAMQPGVLVRCPKCTHQFRVPASAGLDAPAPPPLPPAAPPGEPSRVPPEREPPSTFEQTPRRSASQDAFDFDAADEPRAGTGRKRADEEESPRRRRDDPDDEEWDEDRPPRDSRDRGSRDRGASLSADYDINLGEWFNRATDHWPTILGPAVGFVLLAGLLFFVGYFLAFLLSLPLLAIGLPPLLAPVAAVFLSPLFEGLTIIAFRQIRGDRWTFGDFFSSVFEYYGPLLGLNFFFGLMNFVCMIPLFIIQIALGAGLAFAVSSRGGGGAATQLGGMMILFLPLTYLACLFGFMALYTKLGTFAVPLVIHRRFGPIEAMRGSWQLTEGHFWGLLGFNFLVGLISFGGMVVCVGPLFLLPLASLLRVVAYARAVHLPIARPVSRYDDRDDDDYDRPRRRSRRDEEDEDDDRPRGGRSRRDEIDEDDRPRPRRSRSRPDDDY